MPNFSVGGVEVRKYFLLLIIPFLFLGCGTAPKKGAPSQAGIRRFFSPVASRIGSWESPSGAIIRRRRKQNLKWAILILTLKRSFP